MTGSAIVDRRAAALAAMLLTFTACTAQPATSDGGASAEPTASPSASAGEPSEAPTPTVSPTPEPSESAGPPQIAWSEPEPFDGNPNGIFDDGGTWVVGGWALERGPAAWTSTDAVTWTSAEVTDPRPDDLFTGSGLGPIIRLGDSLLSYGTFVGCCDGRGVLGWSSSDGAAWEVIASDSPLFEHGYLVTGLANGDPALVAIELRYGDRTGRIWRWTPSTSWVDVTPVPGLDPTSVSGIEANDVVFADGRYVIVGVTGEPGAAAGNGASWVSTDGEAWEASAPQEALEDVRLSEVAPMPDGGLLAIGHTDYANYGRAGVPVAFASADGLTWTPVDAPPAESPSQPVELLVVGNGFVALTSAGTGVSAWTSADGASWTESAHFENEFRVAAADAEQVLVFTADYSAAPPDRFQLHRGEIEPSLLQP